MLAGCSFQATARIKPDRVLEKFSGDSVLLPCKKFTINLLPNYQNFPGLLQYPIPSRPGKAPVRDVPTGENFYIVVK